MSTEENKQTSGDAGAASPETLASAQSTQTVVQGAAKVTSNKPTSGEVAKQALDRIIDNYVEAMAPNKPVTVEEGTTQQRNLWRAIRQVLNLKGPDFLTVYRHLLNRIQEHRGTVFSEYNAWRFHEYLKALSASERAAFSSFVNLLLVTSDPRGRRQALSRFDMRSVYRYFEGTDIPDKLTEFYEL